MYDFVGVRNIREEHFPHIAQQKAKNQPMDSQLVFVVQEFMKATVDLADLLGLHLVMSRNAGKGEYKIMVAAMGWATAELVMSR